MAGNTEPSYLYLDTYLNSLPFLEESETLIHKPCVWDQSSFDQVAGWEGT